MSSAQESLVYLRRPFQVLMVIVFLTPLLAFAYIGHFSRYIADDYCTTSVALARGLVGSVVQWYTTWAGQYTNWLLKGIVANLGPGFPAFLPALILCLWLGATVWTIAQIMSALQLSPPRWLVWALGAMFVFAVFAGIPSIIQSLYWFGASIPYTLPLAFLVFYIGFFVRSLQQSSSTSISKSAIFFSFFLSLVAGGTSEVFVAFQIAVIGLILVISLVTIPAPVKVFALWLSGAALLGAVLALVLIVIAPGTAIRQAAFSAHLSLFQVAIQTVLASAVYPVLAIGVFSPIPLLIALVIPAVIFSQIVPQNSVLRLRPNQSRRWFTFSGGIAFILLMASFAPSIYAASATPPPRIYIFPQLVLVSLACFWGIIAGLGIRGRALHSYRSVMALGAVLLVAGPLLTAIQTLRTAPQFSTYATEWDSRDQFIRTAAAEGENSVEVDMLTVDMGKMANLEPLGPDPNGDVNLCAESYYGVQSLSVRTPLQMGIKPS